MEPCTPCAYAAEHGFWGDTLPKGVGTHCRTCHSDVLGDQQHCTCCHQSYRSSSAFTRHQMVAGCPDIEGAVSDVAAEVSDALSRYVAAQNERGDHRYLVQDERYGVTFWRWNSNPQEVF